MTWMLWLVLPALAEAPADAATTWTVDGAKSTVYAKIHLEESALANSTGALHHAVRLGLVDGSVTTAGDTVTAAEVEGVVASLKPGDAALRKAAEMTGALSEAEAGTLLDCVFNQLQPEVDNTVSFTATSAEGSLDALKVKGTFRMHGVEQTVQVPLKLVVDGETLRATGELPLNLPDYGFRIPDSGWTVKDEATVVLDLVLSR